MMNYSDFDKAYASGPDTVDLMPCTPPTCFVGSYAPVTKAGEQGPFYVNTYLLQPDRSMGVLGPTTVRSSDLSCKK